VRGFDDRHARAGWQTRGPHGLERLVREYELLVAERFRLRALAASNGQREVEHFAPHFVERPQPTSSPVSSKMQAEPAAISRSKARPTAGLAVMPLVPSEPPQIVPTTSSSRRMGTFFCAASCARALRTHSRPL